MTDNKPDDMFFRERFFNINITTACKFFGVRAIHSFDATVISLLVRDSFRMCLVFYFWCSLFKNHMYERMKKHGFVALPIILFFS